MGEENVLGNGLGEARHGLVVLRHHLQAPDTTQLEILL